MNDPCSEKSSSEPSYSSKLSRLAVPLLVGGELATSGTSFLLALIGSYALPCGSSPLLKRNDKQID